MVRIENILTWGGGGCIRLYIHELLSYFQTKESHFIKTAKKHSYCDVKRKSLMTLHLHLT